MRELRRKVLQSMKRLGFEGKRVPVSGPLRLGQKRPTFPEKPLEAPEELWPGESHELGGWGLASRKRRRGTVA